MPRYEIRLGGNKTSIRPRNWRLIERKGGGESRYAVLMEGCGDQIRLPKMNYGPLELCDVRIHIAEQTITFNKSAEDCGWFRMTDPSVLSSYAVEIGDRHVSFMIDGSRRPRK